MAENKEAVEAVRRAIARRYGVDWMLVPEDVAEDAIAAARPFILEEAARIAETTMNHQRVDGHTMTFPGDPKSIAAAIRAAKEG